MTRLPRDGRTECATCGKLVYLVIHSCKGIRLQVRADPIRDQMARAWDEGANAVAACCGCSVPDNPYEDEVRTE